MKSLYFSSSRSMGIKRYVHSLYSIHIIRSVGGVLDYMVTKYVFAFCQLIEITPFTQYSSFWNELYVVKFVYVAHLVHTMQNPSDWEGPKDSSCLENSSCDEGFEEYSKPRYAGLRVKTKYSKDLFRSFKGEFQNAWSKLKCTGRTCI